MDPDLKLKITNRLRIFLNRDPSEREIINGQNDSTLRAWIAEDDAHEQNALTEILATTKDVDFETAKIHAKLIAAAWNVDL